MSAQSTHSQHWCLFDANTDNLSFTSDTELQSIRKQEKNIAMQCVTMFSHCWKCFIPNKNHCINKCAIILPGGKISAQSVMSRLLCNLNVKRWCQHLLKAIMYILYIYHVHTIYIMYIIYHTIYIMHTIMHTIYNYHVHTILLLCTYILYISCITMYNICISLVYYNELAASRD